MDGANLTVSHSSQLRKTSDATLPQKHIQIMLYHMDPYDPDLNEPECRKGFPKQTAPESLLF